MIEKYPDGSAASLYESRVATRQPYVTRAQEVAKLTIPSIMPVLGHTGATTLHSPFQSVGSRGCKNIASKLLLAILPPNAPFFRLSIDDETLSQLTQDDADKEAVIADTLNKMERTVQTHIEQTTARVTTAEALLHYIIVGNVLMYVPKDGNARLFPLTQYVVIRDPSGTVLKVITKEEVARETLTPEQLAVLETPTATDYPNAADATKDGLKTVCLYTQMSRVGKKWEVYQELNGHIVPGSDGSYPEDSPAYIPLRFRKIDGEDYGRSFGEEIIGDLRSLEGLSQSMVEAAAGLSKILILVNPNGLTSKKTISNTPNLSVRDGRKEDVSFLQSDKSFDLSWARAQADKIEGRLELAFLLNSAVQRNAERVTAEEIRYVALELEDTLGGIYSLLSQEFQMPLVKRFMTILQQTKKLPVLPSGVVSPQIITGLESLGRGHDLDRLDTFVQGVVNMVGPENLATYVNVPALLKERAIAVGIKTDLLNSPEQVQQIQQQQQMAKLAEKATPNAVTQIGQHAQQAAAAASGQQSQPQQ